MFHVERIIKSKNNTIKTTLFLGLLLLISCIATRQTIQIPDYILEPNGKEVIGKKSLTAFIFENNQKNSPIENYLSSKFKTDNYLEKEFCVNISKDKYKIIVYDAADFEKYFNSSNYAMINQLPDNAKVGDSRKFIAISMINSFNEDCLAEGSLFQNIATKYLKTLKDEYYNQ